MRTLRRTTVALAVAGATCGMTLAFTTAAPAYNNPNYPGSTLSLALSGASAPGQVTTIIASGTNTTEEIGGYQLDMYAKVASLDHTCANTSAEEKSTNSNEPSESEIAIGLSEGFGPFSVPVKAQFNPGTTLLCGYSLWSYDTAVSAQLMITTGSGGSGPLAPSQSGGSSKSSTGPPSGYVRAVAKCKKRYKGNANKKKRAKCIAAAKHHYHVK
jgi:hypothetical protein